MVPHCETNKIRRFYAYAFTPNKAPTPAVSAMANAPQKVTRIDDVMTDAPPARAASEPNIARNKSELAATAHINIDAGTNSTTSNGNEAPTANVTAEASAACRSESR